MLVVGASVSDGFPALRIRGGSYTNVLPPHFVHAVLLGLFANSLAEVMAAMLLSVLEPFTNQSSMRPVRVYTCKLFAVFTSYLAVFILTGFVPMGYVPGAKPLLPIFTEH